MRRYPVLLKSAVDAHDAENGN